MKPLWQEERWLTAEAIAMPITPATRLVPSSRRSIIATRYTRSWPIDRLSSSKQTCRDVRPRGAVAQRPQMAVDATSPS